MSAETKKIAKPRECAGDGQPCDRCGVVVGAEFRRCTVDLTYSVGLVAQKPVMRLCLRCIAALEKAGANVRIALSPDERRAKLRLVKQEQSAADYLPTMPKKAADGSKSLIYAVAQEAVEFMIGKHRLGDKTRENAIDILAKAIERKAAAIIRAAEAAPKLEREQEAAAAREVAARRKLSDGLRGSRKRLNQLRAKIQQTTAELGRMELQVAIRQMEAQPGQYPVPPAPFLAPSKEGAGLPEVAGIYFLWRNDVVEYVGQSIKLCNRARFGHHRIRPDHRISYIEVPETELDWAECWYIGNLRPRLNFGEHSSANRAARRAAKT